MEWSLDKKKLEQRRYGRLNLQGPYRLRQRLKHQGGRVVFENKSMSWKSHRGPAWGGLLKTLESTIGEEWSPSPLPSVSVSDQESTKECG